MNDQVIGKYRVIRKIGAGGMASVFLAVHQDIPSLHVVLKQLGDHRQVERFKREAEKLATLDGHPGICQIKHFFDHDGAFYIAMEYIDGQDLQSLVEKEGRLDLGPALLLTRSILDILEVAHYRGICHRDIKPTNIMIDRNDNLKIIDFGLAKAESDPHLTSVGTSLGSPLYMAPEQFNPDDHVDYVRCDLYAVGITLFFMLTGALPFDGSNLVQIIQAKMTGDPPSPRTVNPDIPAAMEALILKAIARDPRQRFGSAAEMKLALGTGAEAAKPAPAPAGEATVALDQAVLPKAAPRPNPPKKRIRPWPAAGAAVILIGAVGWGAGWFSGSQNAPATATGPATQPVDRTAAASSGPGVVLLRIEPSGDVFVDGDLFGRGLAECRLELPPGEHLLSVENAASEEGAWTRQLSVQAGDSLDHRVVFTIPAAAGPESAQAQPAVGSATTADPPAAAQGELAVGSLPVLGARIFLDGEDTHFTTPYTLRLDAGEYRVKVVMMTAEGAREQEEIIQVEAGTSQKKIFRFN